MGTRLAAADYSHLEMLYSRKRAGHEVGAEEIIAVGAAALAAIRQDREDSLDIASPGRI